ncbi:MAG TPA: hypothetical protein VFM68_02020 [Candidatus Saccharimonadales bacterium]|nr:hypothetical protein [Candidatus Saccharimonadales bacterium]
MKKILLIILAVCLFVALSAGVYYEVVYTDKVANRYVTDLRDSAENLREVFGELENSTDTPLLYDAGASAEARQASGKKLNQSIADSRQALTQFQSVSTELSPIAYAGYTPTYSQAVILQERSQDIVTQTTDTLNRFETAITFLQTYGITLNSSMEKIEQFNQVSNLDTLADETDALRATATRIKTTTDILKQTDITPDLTTTQSLTVHMLTEAADGFDDLARGLDAADDKAVDEAARKIEKAGKQLDATWQKTYTDTTPNLRVLQNVHELNEKLDLVLP